MQVIYSEKIYLHSFLDVNKTQIVYVVNLPADVIPGILFWQKM